MRAGTAIGSVAPPHLLHVSLAVQQLQMSQSDNGQAQATMQIRIDNLAANGFSVRIGKDETLRGLIDAICAELATAIDFDSTALDVIFNGKLHAVSEGAEVPLHDLGFTDGCHVSYVLREMPSVQQHDSSLSEMDEEAQADDSLRENWLGNDGDDEDDDLFFWRTAVPPPDYNGPWC